MDLLPSSGRQVPQGIGSGVGFDLIRVFIIALCLHKLGSTLFVYFIARDHSLEWRVEDRVGRSRSRTPVDSASVVLEGGGGAWRKALQYIILPLDHYTIHVPSIDLIISFLNCFKRSTNDIILASISRQCLMSDADYWNKLNEDCENRARQASDYCQRCWGYGGSEAPWQMRQFADWLEQLYDDIQELIVCLYPHSYAEMDLIKQQANCLYEDTREACMEACAEILALDVDHDRHLKYIVRIRYAIHGEAQWDDWPCDESDESESGAIFRMDEL